MSIHRRSKRATSASAALIGSLEGSRATCRSSRIQRLLYITKAPSRGSSVFFLRLMSPPQMQLAALFLCQFSHALGQRLLAFEHNPKFSTTELVQHKLGNSLKHGWRRRL